ncbi:MAG: hypothetical protein E7286_02445 [Lachnospiraceae bacterium]|nr:hypothetical protein [Lachnospiraceae bacterium]
MRKKKQSVNRRQCKLMQWYKKKKYQQRIVELNNSNRQEAFMEGYNYAIQLLQDSVTEKTK